MKTIALITSLLVLGQAGAVASTTIYSSDFSATSGANSIDGWTYDSSVGGRVVRYTGSFDNFDTAAPVGDGSGPYGGDGVKGDGAIRFDTGDAVAGNEIWSYTLSVLLNEGDTLNLIGSAFNPNASHNANFTVTLYNVTDDRLLVSTSNLGGSRQGTTAEDINPFYDFDVSYTTLAADSGDTIEIRALENLNNTSRDGVLDYIQVDHQAVPEPSRAVLALLGLIGLCLRRHRS